MSKPQNFSTVRAVCSWSSRKTIGDLSFLHGTYKGARVLWPEPGTLWRAVVQDFFATYDLGALLVGNRFLARRKAHQPQQTLAQDGERSQNSPELQPLTPRAPTPNPRTPTPTPPLFQGVVRPRHICLRGTQAPLTFDRRDL